MTNGGSRSNLFASPDMCLGFKYSMIDRAFIYVFLSPILRYNPLSKPTQGIQSGVD